MPREEKNSIPHREAQTGNSEKLLEQIGLRRFTSTELRTANERLINAISIGINRSGNPTTKDGGIPAIPSPVASVTPEQVQNVPDNTRVFAVCWGGTKQRYGIGIKDGRRVFVDQHNKFQVPKDQRTLSTDNFAVLIGRHVLDGVKDMPRGELRGIQAIGVSLGIPQYNTVEANGVDARPWGEPSNWRFTNYDPTKFPSEQPSLSTPLITFLSNQGLDVDKAYFQPDPVAISHDVSGHDDPDAVFLQASILAGTGTNAALNGRNLEVSSSYNLFPNDRILAEMELRGYLPRDAENPNITKMRTGGQRIKLRVAAAMHVLSDMGKIKENTADKMSEILNRQPNGPIVSQIASGNFLYRH